MLDIYKYPELYDAIHKNYKIDKKLISFFAKDAGGPVLELACGTGRLTSSILKLGLNYTGLDSSPEFLSIARKKFDNHTSFYLSDMQNFYIKKKFNFIFIGFNSFLHNLTDASAVSCLKCVYNHLSDSGTFLVSIFIPDPEFLFRDDGFYPVTLNFEFNGAKCRILESNQFDEEKQINYLKWQVERNGVILPEVYHYSLRMIYPHMMDIFFQKAKLKILSKFGDYDLSRLKADSGMQIYLCKKI